MIEIDLLLYSTQLMHSGIEYFQSSGFHFIHFGQGSKVAVCLHGYGESASSFRFLEKRSAGEFTFLAITLPYHDGTTWKERSPLTSDVLMKVINGIFQQLQLRSGKFLLVGYSMGGRIALCLSELYPEKIERICLLAPDGLIVNKWYWLCTQTYLGNRLFRFTMFHPGWFKALLQVANRFRLVNSSIFKFTHQYLGNAQIRIDLYYRWTSMRKFRPNISGLQEKINLFHIPVRMIFGRYDRMIGPELGERMGASIKDDCRITTLDAGHQLLSEKYEETIIAMMKD